MKGFSLFHVIVWPLSDFNVSCLDFSSCFASFQCLIQFESLCFNAFIFVVINIIFGPLSWFYFFSVFMLLLLVTCCFVYYMDSTCALFCLLFLLKG